MTRSLSVLLLMVLVAACSSPKYLPELEKEYLATRPVCHSPTACEQAWSDAREWVLGKTDLALSYDTGVKLETEQLPVRGKKGPGFRLQQIYLGQESNRLDLQVWCFDSTWNLRVCDEEQWQQLLDFNREINGRLAEGLK